MPRLLPRRTPKLTAVPWKDEPMVLVCSNTSPQSLADRWIGKTHLHYALASDPGATIIDPAHKFTSVPHMIVIDPRTMKVAAHVIGLDGGVRYPCKTSDDCCKVGGMA